MSGESSALTRQDVRDNFPRIDLLDGPTPIQRMRRLEEQLQTGVQLYVKRDDFMTVGMGGNKLRKLEYLLGEALDQGCDTFITTGGLQSNHARLSAAATARAGLACELMLTQMVANGSDAYQHNGNSLLDPLFGAGVHVFDAAVPTPLAWAVHPPWAPWAMWIAQMLQRLAPGAPDFQDVVVDDSQLGEGYGIPTPAMQEALRLVARSEGWLLDPEYSGKAFAGLLAAVRNGRYQDGEAVLFLMTGGAPGVFAYCDALRV